VGKRSDKRKNKRNGGSIFDQAQIQADVAQGGLAIFENEGSIFERDAALLHVVPPDMAHSLRFLLSRLQQSDEVGAHQTIAVTSALSGEGVTSVARSLAAIVAHDLNRSVCLLETNWWLDSDGGTELLRRPGLADVLTGACTVDDALVHTSEPRLAILTSGRLPVADRPAIVASSVFTDVLKLLAKGFDTVVIDVPPVLKASEASMIARHADAAVLVVRRGVTTEQQVEMAIDELRGTELLGVILNRSSSRVPRFLRRFALPT
jgi:Mrp family chromosome partitioning ATPase